MSLTLKYIAPDLAPVELVYGQGPQGKYEVSYAVGEADEPEAHPSRSHTIHYAELVVLPHTAESLLENPFLLLHKPEKGGMTEVLGPDIFAQVTLHLVRLAKGEINPQVGYAPRTRFKPTIGSKSETRLRCVKARPVSPCVYLRTLE